MNDSPTIRLKDYQPPAFWIDDVHLVFRLSPNKTRVLSRLKMRRNPAVQAGGLDLDGIGLRLISIRIDGQDLPGNAYEVSPKGLHVSTDHLSDDFTLETEVEIDPAANTALDGLYTSKGMFCTQCEAEGFRKITYYADRPDVMATFSVRIEGDHPVLLSNGNLTGQGPGWAEWSDPWPKPAYLFALVAGDLVSFDDQFTTVSGRKVDLKIWVREGDQDKCAYAMDALKRAMAWDETEYGREYDLDLFQIVAVDDFNMGAMENKGLNIFNSKYVLASPETATDRDYTLIEGIIAHEYFHNWTGNRITCRDWFQLSLKEGLTVFRDQMFSGDQRGHAVQRIGVVQKLRARQFREDAGPLAHPVRPAEYKEINNFYTATVYEKGAELISMLRGLVGVEGYKKALDLYFERHDGQACTIEDWLQVFQDATGRDLAQFALWYSQAGTPRIDVSENYENGQYTLTFRQTNPPTPGQADKSPQIIPIATGLLAANGDEVQPTVLLEMTEPEQKFVFKGLAGKPVASILRGLSAPVSLHRPISEDERIFLLTHDTDPFNKWESGRNLARDTLKAMTLTGDQPNPTYLDALCGVATDMRLEPDFRAALLDLPSIDEISQSLAGSGQLPDPVDIHAARRDLTAMLARAMGDRLDALCDDNRVRGPYSPVAADAGKRALGLAALNLLTTLDGGQQARAMFPAADNMTEQLGALACLLRAGNATAEVAAFYDQWQDNGLVIDKWFALQASLADPSDAVQIAHQLADHADFDWKNPNRFRSLIAGFGSMNPAGFHDPSGAGYAFITDWLLRLDPINPQTAASMCTVFETWRWYDADRQKKMRRELDRMAAVETLSRNTREMVERILQSPSQT